MHADEGGLCAYVLINNGNPEFKINDENSGICTKSESKIVELRPAMSGQLCG